MKKTIKILIDKMGQLQENNDGKLQGGFSSIKGGFNAALFSTNQPWGCTNSHDCTKSTNSGNGCSNTGSCFA